MRQTSRSPEYRVSGENGSSDVSFSRGFRRLFARPRSTAILAVTQVPDFRASGAVSALPKKQAVKNFSECANFEQFSVGTVCSGCYRSDDVVDLMSAAPAAARVAPANPAGL